MRSFTVYQELNVKDRLGKFTLTQWGILAASALLAFSIIIWGIFPLIVNIIVGFILILFGVFIAFFERHGLPIYEFVLLYVLYKTGTKEMVYASGEYDDSFINDEEIEIVFEEE